MYFFPFSLKNVNAIEIMFEVVIMRFIFVTKALSVLWTTPQHHDISASLADDMLKIIDVMELK